MPLSRVRLCKIVFDHNIKRFCPFLNRVLNPVQCSAKKEGSIFPLSFYGEMLDDILDVKYYKLLVGTSLCIIF